MILALIAGAYVGWLVYALGREDEHNSPKAACTRIDAGFYKSCYERAMEELTAERAKPRAAAPAGEAHE